MLEMVDLHKRYGDVVALDGCSFEVHPGRMLGFLGPNGAGKTTTMRSVFGLASRMEDAQNAGAPLTIVALIGYMFSFAALNDPVGVVAIVGTYIPFSAPYVAPIRLAIGDISGWEMTLAVAITVVTIGLMVRMAGRVYAGGLLRYGGHVKWSEAFRTAE
jgi:ABC-type Na+ efflux pump permease subunit